MNLKECVTKYENYKNIDVRMEEITSYSRIKENGEWLLDPSKLLNKKVKDVIINGDKLIITISFSE